MLVSPPCLHPIPTPPTPQGLEVSKPGRYQALPSENFLELSDSGVEFTNPSLPLDSDTDAAPPTYASQVPLLNAVSPTAVTAGGAGDLHSDSPETTVAPQGDFSASRTPDSATSASPASNPRSLAAAPTPDGSLSGAATPETASGGALESEGGAEEKEGEAEQNADSAQST